MQEQVNLPSLTPQPVPIVINNESTPSTPRLSSLRALELLIASEGNLHLAAELGKTTPELLIAAVTMDEGNHNIMASYVRAFTTMKLFSMLSELQQAVSDAITEEKLKPSDLVKMFGNTVEAISSLTDSKTSTQNINVFDQVAKSLPPDVREALKVVAKDGEAVS